MESRRSLDIHDTSLIHIELSHLQLKEVQMIEQYYKSIHYEVRSPETSIFLILLKIFDFSFVSFF